MAVVITQTDVACQNTSRKGVPDERTAVTRDGLERVSPRAQPALACRRSIPTGFTRAIAGFLKTHLGDAATVRTATLDQPEHGLTEQVLAETDVLTWWGHTAHADVADAVVDRVQRRVLEGMGLVVLHSAHASKIFRRLMGTSCMLRWREAGERERVWIVDPSHPIVDGLEGECFELPHVEMYGEFFDIPTPGKRGVHQLVRGWRGVSLRLHVPPRQGKDLLFQPRPRDVSDLL